MTFRSFTLTLIFPAALAASAQAASQKETSKDWTASLEKVNTGEDLRKICGASTTAKDAAGKDWTLKLAISNGDVLPPDAYPSIVVTTAQGGLPSGESQPAVALSLAGFTASYKKLGTWCGFPTTDVAK